MVYIPAEKMIAHVVFGILLFLEGLSRKDHCHRKTMYVEDVTEHTAVLQWKGAKTTVDDYKILCAGVRQYTTAEGNSEVETNTVTRFVPQGVDQAFLNNLQPNFNYSCVVTADSGQFSIEETKPLLFSTPFSRPEVPQPPAITREHGKPVDLKLFPTSTKYGPIDGYEVQFHILDQDTPHLHGNVLLPKELTRPYGLLASVGDAQRAEHAMPFTIHYKNHSFPGNITISSNLLHGALRSGITYCVITVAYTDNYEDIKNPQLYSISLPSETFTLTVTADRVQSDVRSRASVPWLRKHVIKISIVVGVVASSLILLYFVAVGCCIMCLEARRKRALVRRDGGCEQDSSGRDLAVECQQVHVGSSQLDLCAEQAVKYSVQAHTSSNMHAGGHSKNSLDEAPDSSRHQTRKQGLIRSLFARRKHEKEGNRAAKATGRRPQCHAFDTEHSLPMWSHHSPHNEHIPVLPRHPRTQGKGGPVEKSGVPGPVPTAESFAAHVECTSSRKTLDGRGSVSPSRGEVKSISADEELPSSLQSAYPEQSCGTSDLELSNSAALAGYSVQQWVSSSCTGVHVSGVELEHATVNTLMDAQETSDATPREATRISPDDPSVDSSQVQEYCTDYKNLCSADDEKVDVRSTHGEGQTLEQCVSSVMFLPRGMSSGPLRLPPQARSTEELGIQQCVQGEKSVGQASEQTDQAPELEMDLYGISYCDPTDETHTEILNPSSEK